MRFIRLSVLLLGLSMVLLACPAKKDGAITGHVSPAGGGIRVVALQQSAIILQADVSAADGGFRMSLPAGTYDIKVTATTSPLPVMLNGVVVRTGEATPLGTIALAPIKGAGTISGKVIPPTAGTRVALISDGIERASISTSPDGRYEFEGLPSGRYTVQAVSSGYASDAVPVVASDNERSHQDFRLIYITAIEGVDWSAGKIRARGIGLPPKQAPTPTVRREMARRAALSDAERNLIRIVEMINVAPGQPVASVLGEKTFPRKLQGYLQGYQVAAERDMDGGRVEVELELPLTGPGGLSSHIRP
ncbi:MAG: carboxypeptidase regulatory-like domain-containing protein [Nitrospirota bacterium]